MIGPFLVAVPIAIYLMAALSVRREDVRLPDTFFTAHRKVDVTVFSTSSIAYAFQMSTIYPFIVWGASTFFFVPIVNTLFWGVGILLFQLSFRRYESFVGRDQTLHGLLGDHYGNSIRKLASYLTITGFLGFAVAELYFGSQVLLSISQGKHIVYISIVGVSTLVYIYIAYGGQLSSMRTDQLQLAISYLGFFGIILYFLYVIFSSQSRINPALTIASLVGAIYIPYVLYKRRGRFLRLGFGNHAVIAGGEFLNALIVLMLLAIWAFLLLLLRKGTVPTRPSSFFDLTGFGLPGLLSLAILPLCFQFVDLTNWQRLLSVRPSSVSTGQLRKDIGRGLLIYSVESPFTWLVALFLGALITCAVTGVNSENLLVDLPRHLIRTQTFTGRVIAYTFILSVISVMLSTVDSFLVGVIYTFTYDSYGPTQQFLDTKDADIIESKASYIISSGRRFGALALTLTLAMLFTFDRAIPNGGSLFVNLLLAFYSAQLSFFPLVFGVLFLRTRPTARWAGLSMGLGAGSGIGLGVYSVIWNPTYAWYPLLVCFGISCSVYVAGYLQARGNSVQDKMPGA
jgi:hypothetical protein